MIPIGDDNTDRRSRPVITWAIIALNVLVFVLFQGCGSNDRFTYAWSTVPEEILTGKDLVTADQTVTDPSSGQRYLEPGLGVTPISVYLTLLVSMFMHGSFAHIAGNMLYLFIFGDNVEDRIGRVRFLLFYLFCGVVASLAQVFVTKWTGQDPSVPSLGASGAISGVLGAYLLLFPRKRVRVIALSLLIPVPAWVAVGIWFVFQLINGLGYLGGSTGGGVAYAAHVGGFVAGIATIKLWDRPGRAPQRYAR
ncbi:MAG: rhomboid family intramembrane serine protease [Spirochaetes bacterium]|nr:rhomboid family intramembrane serine protease [Spirochaetota bacterium]